MQQMQYIRVDERLIHGQVIVEWLNFLEIQRLVVIDDVLQHDLILKSAMRMSLPKEIESIFCDVEEGSALIEKQVMQKERYMILVRDIFTLEKLLRRCEIKAMKINIARLPYKSGSIQLRKNIFVTEEELKILKKFSKQNMDISIQMVPESKAEKLIDTL